MLWFYEYQSQDIQCWSISGNLLHAYPISHYVSLFRFLGRTYSTFPMIQQYSLFSGRLASEIYFSVNKQWDCHAHQFYFSQGYAHGPLSDWNQHDLTVCLTLSVSWPLQHMYDEAHVWWIHVLNDTEQNNVHVISAFFVLECTCHTHATARWMEKIAALELRISFDTNRHSGGGKFNFSTKETWGQITHLKEFLKG